jgi:CDP-diacylglycerol--inositol 3-phosphatidyltransferase
MATRSRSSSKTPSKASTSRASATRSRPSSPRNVWLFVPNLIGYARILLMLGCFAISKTSPRTAVAMYLTSFLLDAADGYAARLLGQSSKFGAVLDMVTDR